MGLGQGNTSGEERSAIPGQAEANVNRISVMEAQENKGFKMSSRASYRDSKSVPCCEGPRKSLGDHLPFFRASARTRIQSFSKKKRAAILELILRVRVARNHLTAGKDDERRDLDCAEDDRGSADSVPVQVCGCSFWSRSLSPCS